MYSNSCTSYLSAIISGCFEYKNLKKFCVTIIFCQKYFFIMHFYSKIFNNINVIYIDFRQENFNKAIVRNSSEGTNIFLSIYIARGTDIGSIGRSFLLYILRCSFVDIMNTLSKENPHLNNTKNCNDAFKYYAISNSKNIIRHFII